MTLSIINISKEQMQEFIESDAVEESFKRKLKQGLRSDESIYKIKYEEDGSIEIEPFKKTKKILKEYLDSSKESLQTSKATLSFILLFTIIATCIKYFFKEPATEKEILVYGILFLICFLFSFIHYVFCKLEYNEYIKIDKYVDSTSHDYIEKNKAAMNFFS